MRDAKLLCLLILLLFPHWGYALKAEDPQRDWQLNEIEEKASGFMERVSGDPYIIFPELGEVQYNISGVEVEISFSPMIVKPFQMELFWRPEHDGFSEQRKLFFIILPREDTDTIKFYIPLNAQDGYKQFRLDFPGDIPSLFQVKEFRPVTDEQEIGKDVERVEAFYRISITETRTPEIIIPYLVHTFQHGLGKLLKDPPFLIVWLGLIFALLLGIRVVSRSIRRQEVGREGSDPGN